MSAIQQTTTKRTVRINQFDTTPPVVPVNATPFATASGGQYYNMETQNFGSNTGAYSTNATFGSQSAYEQDLSAPEKEHHGLLEKLIEVKDKITGNTPEHKAIKYSEKCVKELKKENKYAEEAEECAEKGAKKAEKYAHKAEKYLEKKEKACEKAAAYHEKSQENAEKARECRDAHFQKDADLLHDAACRLQQAH